MVLYFITGSNEKLEEARAIIPSLQGLKLDLPELQELNPEKIIRAKLEEARKRYNGRLAVEDTSLYLNCLNGMPGPLIKWFMQSLGNNGVYDLVSRYDDTSAVARTVVGYIEDEEIKIFEGEINGTIVAPQKMETFGWDSIFQPEGYSVTFAEMSKEEKSRISMRTKAFEKLKEYLEDGDH